MWGESKIQESIAAELNLLLIHLNNNFLLRDELHGQSCFMEVIKWLLVWMRFIWVSSCLHVVIFCILMHSIALNWHIEHFSQRLLVKTLNKVPVLFNLFKLHSVPSNILLFVLHWLIKCCFHLSTDAKPNKSCNFAVNNVTLFIICTDYIVYIYLY